MSGASSRGRMAHQGGLAAEEAALRAYQARGAMLLASRWRSPAGEIDLIVQMGTTIVFAEIKARRDIDSAAHAIGPRQTARLMAAAEIWLAQNAPPGTDARFDAVLFDRTGQTRIIENALL